MNPRYVDYLGKAALAITGLLISYAGKKIASKIMSGNSNALKKRGPKK